MLNSFYTPNIGIKPSGSGCPDFPVSVEQAGYW